MCHEPFLASNAAAPLPRRLAGRHGGTAAGVELRRRRRSQGQTLHPAVDVRRPQPHRHVRHEARCSGGDSRPVQADRHQRQRHSHLRAPAAAGPPGRQAGDHPQHEDVGCRPFLRDLRAAYGAAAAASAQPSRVGRPRRSAVGRGGTAWLRLVWPGARGPPRRRPAGAVVPAAALEVSRGRAWSACAVVRSGARAGSGEGGAMARACLAEAAWRLGG